MATIKAIKKRISSVTSTKKILKAMDLVAASKLQKSKARLDDIRPMCENIKKLIHGAKAGIDANVEVPFAENREVKTAAYIVITGDRGLCGGYNANISKEALACIDENSGIEEKIITVGSKGWEYFRRRGKNIAHRSAGASEATVYADAELLGNRVASMYTSGEVDEVYLIHTQFKSILSHIPGVTKLLPLRMDDTEQEPVAVSMLYDPDVSTFITHAVPMYLNISILGAMMESTVCEQASRMTSMDAATRNATEVIDDLTLEYNRKRQGMITQEITEIVTGANALQ